jgi:hypothetical protein
MHADESTMKRTTKTIEEICGCGQESGGSDGEADEKPLAPTFVEAV